MWPIHFILVVMEKALSIDTVGAKLGSGLPAQSIAQHARGCGRTLSCQ